MRNIVDKVTYELGQKHCYEDQVKPLLNKIKELEEELKQKENK